MGQALGTGVRVSATFYPVETYPGWIRWLVEITPLYQGVALDAL